MGSPRLYFNEYRGYSLEYSGRRVMLTNCSAWVEVGTLAAYPDTGTGVKPYGSKDIVVRCCHQSSEPDENRTEERRKVSAIITTDRNCKDIIYVR
jgi:hypothetical protein